MALGQSSAFTTVSNVTTLRMVKIIKVHTDKPTFVKTLLPKRSDKRRYDNYSHVMDIGRCLAVTIAREWLEPHTPHDNLQKSAYRSGDES